MSEFVQEFVVHRTNDHFTICFFYFIY